MEHMDHSKKKAFWKNPIVIIGLVAVGYWLYVYHPQHALGFLPYAILLLCPLLHIFMHGGHGHGGHNNHSNHRNHKEHDKEHE